jgi:cobalamin synthase
MNALLKNIPQKYGRWAMCHGALWMLSAVGTLTVFLDKGTQEMAVFPSWYPVALALVGFVVAWLLATGASRAVCRAWGGLTGDVYGAMVEGMEVATLLAFVVMGHLMWSSY